MFKINKVISLVSIISIASLTNIAYAEHEGHDIENDFFYSSARVLDVQPIIRNIQVSTPHRECWNEEITRPVYTEHNSGNGKIILGGIIGGVAGHQFGRGNGKRVATIAGTILGATIANNSARNHRYTTREDYVDVEHHCRVTQTTYSEEKIEGYWVTYQFKGTKFKTRLNQKPDNHIKVRVQVTPEIN